MLNRSLYAGIVLAGTVLLAACGPDIRNRTHQQVSLNSIYRGRRLAADYCQSCHLLPDPGLADSRDWEQGILPAMGPRLGIFSFKSKDYPSAKYDPSVSRSFYPSRPLLTKDQWQDILDYYGAVSPDSLQPQHRDRPIRYGLHLFSTRTSPDPHGLPVSAFVGIDSTTPEKQIVVGSMLPGALLRYDRSLRLTDSLPVKGAVVDMLFDRQLVCNIGNINPNNGRLGSVSRVKTDSQGKMRLDTVPLFDKLARPVQLLSADLNGDGRTDYVVCEFGNLSGDLSWMENTGKGSFVRHVLRAAPGAIRAYVQDYNHDGLPDLWVLFAQGDEGIFLFTNTGRGTFRQEQILRFPPIYGSSYFELDDLNHDGYPDIVYTCGDNADFSPILKPYHGVYIFLNDGRNKFRQAWFYPLNGCYKAIARDFDGDGEPDIATISFFADFVHQPEEGFVYFRNIGHLHFQPYTIPEAKLGRWITMTAGDLDGDGKDDLVLGNFSVGPTPKNASVNWKKGPLFLFLHNDSPRTPPR